MMHVQSPAGKRWQGKFLQPFLHFHDAIEHTPIRRAQVRALAVIGALGMPLYYALWQFCFPQEYESPLLRGVAALLFLPALWPGRFSNTWFSVYLFLGLTFELPFFFTYMFLMNHASPSWRTSKRMRASASRLAASGAGAELRCRPRTFASTLTRGVRNSCATLPSPAASPASFCCAPTLRPTLTTDSTAIVNQCTGNCCKTSRLSRTAGSPAMANARQASKVPLR